MSKLRVIGLSVSAVVSMAMALAMPFEGLRLKSYLDPVGIPTACYGTTLDIRLGMIFTKQQCEDMMRRDMMDALKVVDSELPGISVYQRAAFASFVYNVGVNAFRHSTLLKMAKAGDIVGACNQLPLWVYAGGKKYNGLVRRRAAEKELCLQGV